tara:strand:+ start:829 stop:1287 length:459 start_codon:yes stop_codon:yes gene_type:complete
MKKLIIICITLLFLNNCGYTPIYSAKKNNFYIKEISLKDKNKINLKIAENIKRFSNSNSENVVKLEINSNKKINIISKDAKGDPSRFKMIISLNLNIISKNNDEINKIRNFNENFDYNNNSNKFSLKQYEKEIEDILINKIVENSIIYLSEI